jgi:carbon monoxide dehydrogenase subunit G
MIQIDKQTFINRPPQEVFNFVSDPANSMKYISGTQSSEWTSNGPVGVGSTWKTVTRFLGRDIEAELEITDWQPPTQNSYKAISGPVPFEMTVKAEPQGEGTLLTQTGKVEFGGFFKLAEGLAGKQLDKQMEADMHTLKVLLESDSG